MKKKNAFIAVVCTLFIILGGLESRMFYGTQFMESRPGFSFSVSLGNKWWDCNWSYCKKITIDHTKVQSTQNNFPVLIYISADSDLATDVQSDGDDIIFVDRYNTTQYSHEIEGYNSITGELTAWVMIPRLYASLDTILYMYYGNPTTSNQQNVTGVWDSNFKMVQHLNKNSEILFDSTLNFNNGENNGATYNSSSIIDGGYDFYRYDNISIYDDSSLDIESQITLEGWAKNYPSYTTIGSNKEIISKGQDAYSIVMNPRGTSIYGFINGNSVSTSIDSSWHYICITYDSANLKLYKDGEYIGSTKIGGNINTNSNNLIFGKYMIGTIDELRVSNISRDAAWINTTYQNINNPTTFSAFSKPIGILTTWKYRKEIWIQSLKVETVMANFPVLISTTDTDLKIKALSNGNDILFTSSSVCWRSGSYTEKLAHEIEKYDNSTGELVAWVNVTSLSNITNTSIYMYYGNSLCMENKEDIKGVWDSNFVGVWHLHDTPSNGQNYNDSTAKNHDITFHDDNGNSNTNVIGKIDGAVDLNSDADYMGKSHHSDFNLSQFTLECWVYQDIPTVADYLFLIDKEIDDYTDRNFALYLNSSGNNPIVQTRHVGGNYTVFGKTDLSCGGWYYLTATADISWLKLFINGKSEGTPVNIYNAPILLQKAPLMIGRQNNSIDGEYWKGKIDEVRISKIARNNSWINTTYYTTSSPSTFLEFGEQEINNVEPTQKNPSPSDGATGQSINPILSIEVNDINNNAMNVTFWTNATGTWRQIGYNESVYNGTYSQTYSNMIKSGTKYWWSVNVSDGTVWTNITYNFTTYYRLVIYPSDEGRSTNLKAYPDVGSINHYKCIDDPELVPNNEVDFVYTTNSATLINDTYRFTDHSFETGYIDYINVYLCGRNNGTVSIEDPLNEMKPVMYITNETNSSWYDKDTIVLLTPTWITYNWSYAASPLSDEPWSWDEIDQIQVGVALRGREWSSSNCTQVYIEVIYTPS